MTARHDILDRSDSLQKPFLLSAGVHAAFFALAAGYGLMPLAEVIQWGDPNSLGGGSVTITPVSKIPVVPRSGRVNPVANDTESRVPAAPPEVKPQPRQQVKEEPEEAIAIQSRTPARSARERRQRANPSRASVPRENQLYSSSGAAAVTEMFGTTGGGGVGVGTGNPFGNRFGWYVNILREKVARTWNTGQVDPRLQTAPVVVVTFEIRRDGSVGDVRFLQRSGVATLDYSCQRAVVEAAPFPPLPPAFERDVARIEFWFELKR